MGLYRGTYVACRTPSKRIVYGWVIQQEAYCVRVTREDDGSEARFYDSDVRVVEPWETRVTFAPEPPYEREARARRTSESFARVRHEAYG